jgi:nucleoside-diphosphate-sugar epimerase
MESCEQVYHTAALVRLWTKDRNEFYRVNVDGTRNVLAAATEGGVKKLVFTSTCGVLGASLNEPLSENDNRMTKLTSYYDYTKSIAEDLVHKSARTGFPMVIVSLTKVFGPGIETHPISVNQMIQKFMEGKTTVIPRPASLVSNFCFIDDVIRGHVLAMKRGIAGEKYILGGENIPYGNFFEILRKITASKARLVEAPEWLAKFYAAFYWLSRRLADKEIFFSVKSVNAIYCNKAFSSQKAITRLGYTITPLEEALGRTVKFLSTRQC